MSDSMIEFLNREKINERIDTVSKNFYDMEITDDVLKKDIEDDMNMLLTTLSTELAKHGELEKVWPMAISYLLDTVMAQLIVVKLQNKFIEDVKKGDDDADNE